VAAEFSREDKFMGNFSQIRIFRMDERGRMCYNGVWYTVNWIRMCTNHTREDRGDIGKRCHSAIGGTGHDLQSEACKPASYVPDHTRENPREGEKNHSSSRMVPLPPQKKNDLLRLCPINTRVIHYRRYIIYL
jgi:hypothetical protein